MNQKLTVLITGTSSGLGRKFAEALARKGHTVFASMRNINGKNAAAANQLKDWAKSEQLALEPVELDVANEASVEAGVKTVIDTTGRIDVVINNAGVFTTGLLEGFTTEQYQDLFNVNFFGAVRVNRAVLPFMRRQRSGLLLHISSQLGRVPMPFVAVYSSSKFALEAMAEAYRYELSSLGVDVAILEAGAYPTGMETRGMAPADEKIAAEYGSVAELPGKLAASFGVIMSAADAPNPQEVVDAVVALVETPAGQRPLRTVVDRYGEGVETINKTALEVQTKTMEMMGFQDLMKLSS